MKHLFPRRPAPVALVAALSLLILALPAAADEPGTPRIEIVNARTPLPGVLSGGQVTEEQLAEAAAAGFRTVVNLRTSEEPLDWNEPARVEELGMRYVSLPIAGAAGVTRDNAEKLARILEKAERPLLLHCGSGNRIGALFALQAYYLEGEAPETALRIGLDAGLTKLEPKVREVLGLPAEE